MNAPKFWDKKDSFLGKLLKPFGSVYAWVVASRLRSVKPYQASVPVICVGNISVGGVGKTPVCLALGSILKKMNQSFFFLNHGYKAEQKGVLVDKMKHTALDVGDEALLLNEMAHTIVDNNRARGAQLAEKMGAKMLIMDDGFQNPSLVKTFSFVVVDGTKGFGNERVLPAGPLREPILKGLKRADAIVLVGADKWGVQDFLNQHQIDLPVLKGSFQIDLKQLSASKGQPVFAFAGLGNPGKFFNSLVEGGVNLAQTEVFPDHYFYTRFDIEALKKKAGECVLATTSKDWVKIPQDMRTGLLEVKGEFVFENPDEVWQLLKENL